MKVAQFECLQFCFDHLWVGALRPSVRYIFLCILAFLVHFQVISVGKFTGTVHI